MSKDRVINMRENYATQRNWSNQFNAAIKAVLKSCVPYLTTVNTSSFEDDTKNSFDFYFDTGGGIAGRVRQTKYLSRYEDLTIRSYVPYNGRNTEYHKIFEQGKCRYYFYGWGENGILSKWYLLDLNIIRKYELFKNIKDIKNYDGTYFRSVSFDDLFMYNAVIASSHQLPYHKSMVDTLDNIYFLNIKNA